MASTFSVLPWDTKWLLQLKTILGTSNLGTHSCKIGMGDKAVRETMKF